jgi:hypothetical protein
MIPNNYNILSSIDATANYDFEASTSLEIVGAQLQDMNAFMSILHPRRQFHVRMNDDLCSHGTALEFLLKFDRTIVG